MRAFLIVVAIGIVACAQLGDAELYEAGLEQGSSAGEGTFESVNEVFQARCAFAGCHSSEFPAQGLSLDEGQAFEALLGPDGMGGVAVKQHPDCAGLTLVVPGEPDESCVWVLVENGKMPPGGMPDPLRETIRAWIEAGAPPPAE